MEKNLEQLKHSIATGEMTGSELVRRLQMMIQHEISKPEKEVDTELIEACSSLIEHVYPAIAERPEGYYEEQEAKFKLRLQQKEKERRRQRILRPAIAFAAVLVIVFLSVGSLRFHWFTAESTPDQQQVIIQGHEVSVDMVEKAIAEHDAESIYETNSIDEIEKYLGIPLRYLDLQSQEWLIESISAITHRDSITTIVRYKSSTDNSEQFRYIITFFINPNDVTLDIEQEKAGNKKKVNNVTVYYSTNASISNCSWIAGIAVHNIATTMPMDSLFSIIDHLTRSST